MERGRTHKWHESGKKAGETVRGGVSREGAGKENIVLKFHKET